MRGEAARLAHQAVNDAFRQGLRDRAPDQYDVLLRQFRDATARALPALIDNLGPAIEAGNQQALNEAIDFLLADAWFFRSGYLKAHLIRRVKRAALSEMQMSVLADLVLRVIDDRDRREFRHFCQLARRLEVPGLDEAIAQRLTSVDPDVRRRAEWVAASRKQRASEN